MQMVWQKKEPCFMLISVLMLTTSAFHIASIPKGKSVPFGRLIIGSSRTRNETKDGIVKKLRYEYSGDINRYQADQLESRVWSQLLKLRLRRLSPSVQCDNDSMTLHIQGNQVPNFLVETNEKGPVPLSQMPSHCGFSMKRARRDVVLTAKYDGCNVAQQGNAYILPLRVLGVAVEMVCPVACPLPIVSCSPTAMVVNLGMSPDAIRLKVNGVWQPVYHASSCGFTLEVVGGGLNLIAPYTSNCWQFKGAEMFLPVQYMDVELTMSCPAVQLQAITPLPANMQLGTLADAPMTTTTPATTVAPASADQQALPHWLPAVHYPYAYGMPWHFHYSRPGTPPVAPVTRAPITPATTVAPPSADQQALYQWLPATHYPYTYAYGVPWHFQFSNPGTPPVSPTTKAPTTTVAPASADQQALYTWLLGLYNPSGYGMPYFPYSQPGSPPVIPKTTAPTTTVAPSSADELHFYHLLPVASPGVSVSGFNSGIKQQMYHMPGMNAFPKGLTLNRKSGSPLVNPSKVVPYTAYFSPLQVKGPGN